MIRLSLSDDTTLNFFPIWFLGTRNLDPCFRSSGRKVVLYSWLDSKLLRSTGGSTQLEPEKTADPVAQEVLWTCAAEEEATSI